MLRIFGKIFGRIFIMLRSSRKGKSISKEVNQTIKDVNFVVEQNKIIAAKKAKGENYQIETAKIERLMDERYPPNLYKKCKSCNARTKKTNVICDVCKKKSN